MTEETGGNPEETGGISDETGTKKIEVTHVNDFVENIETENPGEQTTETATEMKTTPSDEPTVK
jgi:hypothetical protein